MYTAQVTQNSGFVIVVVNMTKYYVRGSEKRDSYMVKSLDMRALVH